ncbi:hypothetical protein MNBD_GAMMA08-1748 [hydrothermal vent metagenome]|uniref:Outer membrane protein beta-barrel domain-containing protein n=1 Tax=hydrothermal vent metagenome TaxID=652676 RepID=A0A3B0XYW0_9ZZZZ
MTTRSHSFELNKFIAALFLNLLISNTSFADIDEIYRISVGANLSNYNTELSINSRDASIDAIVDFEDDLGYDSDVNVGWISALYRVGDLHHLKLTYTPLKRSASATNTSDLVIDGTTIKAGAFISSSVQTDIVDFSYIYSFYKTPNLEAGFSAGIYWLFNSTNIFAAGQIQAEGEDQPAFVADYNSEQKLQAPMPLLGLSINYEITPAWRTHASIRFLSVQLSETEGRIFSADIGGEYYFNDNWGMGLSLSSFDLDVEVKNIITSTSLGWAHNGIQIYAVFKY